MVNSNINHFNQYVKVNVYKLKERGESTEDIMMKLIKYYQVASDAKFVRHIKASKYNYADVEEMSTYQLMRLALNEYKILTKSDKWNSMYLEQDHIVGLATVFKKLKYDNLKLYKSIK